MLTNELLIGPIVAICYKIVYLLSRITEPFDMPIFKTFYPAPRTYYYFNKFIMFLLNLNVILQLRWWILFRCSNFNNLFLTHLVPIFLR